MKIQRIILAVILTLFWVTTICAQKYMVVGQKGGVVTQIPTENIDSVFFTGYTVPTVERHDLSINHVGEWSAGDKQSYEGFLIDNNILYAYGDFGIREIDVTNKEAPVLIAENKLCKGFQKARSAVISDDKIYVAVRSTLAGDSEYKVPQIRIGYESNIEKFYSNDTESSLCNNALVSAFFKKLSIVSIDPQSIDRLFIFKAHYSEGIYRNSVMLRQKSGAYLRLFDKRYDSEEEALASLTDSYEDALGNNCIVDWNVITNSYNYFNNLIFNIISYGEFDEFKGNNNIIISETGKGVNTGIYSCMLKSTDLCGSKDFSYLKKNLDKVSLEGSLSFWLRVDTLLHSAEIPLLGINESVSLNVYLENNSNDDFYVGLKYGEAQKTCGGKKIPKGKWNNYKIEIKEGVIEVYQRTIECGDWICLLRNHLEKPLSYNKLLTGLGACIGSNVLYIDDLYYNPTDIDEVAYINGMLVVLDKNNLSIKNKYYSDIKFTGITTIGNSLVVNGLKGFNVYDITDKDSPVQAFQHRTSEWLEYQGGDTFTKDGKNYAFLCNYYSGYTIIDVSNPYETSIVLENSYSDLKTSDGEDCKGFNFDVKVKYPFVYATNATLNANINTSIDKRGITYMDISDFSKIIPEVYVMDREDYSSNRSMGDNHPSRMGMWDKYLFINNAEKGIAIYETVNGIPSYIGCYNKEMTGNIHAIGVTKDGYLVLGNAVGNSTKNIYIKSLYER